jgi:hypothetical protein
VRSSSARYLKHLSHPKFRELNKVYTNGTLVDQELLTDEQAGHCISIREAAAEEANAKTNNSFGICVLDSSTSEFSLSAFEDDVCRTKLETMMRQLRPKEVIFKKVNMLLYLRVIGMLMYAAERAISLWLQLACLNPFCRHPASGQVYGTAKDSVTIRHLPSSRLCTLLTKTIAWRMTMNC